MGSDESHFNVSVGSDRQSHKTVSTNHNLSEEKGEPKRYRTEVLPQEESESRVVVISTPSRTSGRHTFPPPFLSTFDVCYSGPISVSETASVIPGIPWQKEKEGWWGVGGVTGRSVVGDAKYGISHVSLTPSRAKKSHHHHAHPYTFQTKTN